MQTLNPVLLTERATQKLPRVFLLSMCIAFAFSGLIGRDPWRGDDAIGFGVALSMAHGQALELGLMQVAGTPIATEGPLWFAIVAVFIKLFFFIPAHIAAYIPVALGQLLGMSALWYATYYIARTPAAQPLSLALGGGPKPVAYGRAVADGAALLFLATLGIAIKLHELSAESLQFTLNAMLLMGICMAIYKPQGAKWLVFIALFALSANRGLPAILPALLWCVLICIHPAWLKLRAFAGWMLVAGLSGFGLTLLLAYATAGSAYSNALWQWNINAFGFAGWSKWGYLFSNVTFIAWPVLPFAIAAVWRWRQSYQAPHIWVGLSYLLVMFASILFQTNISESHFLTLIPGAVLLAAFLLPALPRAWMNAIDWFGVMVLSFITALAWLGWVAMTLGWPSKLARNILRITPSFDTSLNWLALFVALLVTVFWIFVVRWRVTKPTTVVWRAAVIWSAGTLTVWVLIGSLWMPWLNYGKSYRGVASQLKTALTDHSQCVSPVRLGLPQLAVIAYFGEIKFEPKQAKSLTSNAPEITNIDSDSGLHSEQTSKVACNWLLEYDSLQQLSSLERLPYLPEGIWKLIWEGRRYTDKDERFRLYQRK